MTAERFIREALSDGVASEGQITVERRMVEGFHLYEVDVAVGGRSFRGEARDALAAFADRKGAAAMGITIVGRLTSLAGDAKKAFTTARAADDLGGLALGVGRGAARYGAMAVKELPLAVKQFASNPGRRIERMALQASEG